MNELIEAGHKVTGLARSEVSRKKLTDAGARVQMGIVEDLDCPRRSASAADGVIHTAFYLRHVARRPQPSRMDLLDRS